MISPIPTTIRMATTPGNPVLSQAKIDSRGRSPDRPARHRHGGRPRYRVYFWSADRGRSEEFELTGAADVREALDWAESQAQGRDFQLLVVVDQTAVYLLPELSRSDPPPPSG